jgi:hypothetical protein
MGSKFDALNKNSNVYMIITSKRFTTLCAALSAMCLWPVTLPAQNGITISDFAMKAGVIIFNVSWNKNNMPKEWSDTAWVFVDYNDNGAMKRLPLATSATLTATSAPGVGKVAPAPNNNKGVWLIGNARTAGAFSAPVQLLTATANLSGMCVYAINYPPVGRYTSNTTIAFKGTPKYVVTLDNNQTVTATNPYTIPAGRFIVSFTDASGAPGVIKCTPPVIQTFLATATAYCQSIGSVLFALSGTDKDASYRVYKDGVATDITLAGNGSAATFSRGVNAGGGVYTAWVEAGKYCPAAMKGTLKVTENPLPAKPTITHASRCGPGAVMLQASSPGAVIDWYSAAPGGSLLLSGSNSYTTPSISTGATYYAQARVVATGCLTSRWAVVATVNTVPGMPTMGGAGGQCRGTRKITAEPGVNGTGIRWTDNNSTVSPRDVSSSGTYYAVSTSAAKCESAPSAATVTIATPPIITRTGGDAIQTVFENKPLTPIVYTATNATSIKFDYRTTLPPGVTATVNGTVLTVSGTPTKIGSSSYVAYASNGYCGETSPGTINVMPVAPTTAASTQTWTLSNLIWSDRVVVVPPACTLVEVFPYNEKTTNYKIFEGRYYYSWACVVNQQNVLCPSPWRVVDLNAVQKLLDIYKNRPAELVKLWGTGGFFFYSKTELSQPTGGFYWTTNAYQGDKDAYRLYYSLESADHNRVNRASGYQVRCVR